VPTDISSGLGPLPGSGVDWPEPRYEHSAGDQRFA